VLSFSLVARHAELVEERPDLLLDLDLLLMNQAESGEKESDAPATCFDDPWSNVKGLGAENLADLLGSQTTDAVST